MNGLPLVVWTPGSRIRVRTRNDFHEGTFIDRRFIAGGEVYTVDTDDGVVVIDHETIEYIVVGINCVALALPPVPDFSIDDMGEWLEGAGFTKRRAPVRDGTSREWLWRTDARLPDWPQAVSVTEPGNGRAISVVCYGPDPEGS